MGFISSKNKSAITAGSGGGYLNPSKIQSGGSVRFALLEDQPLEFFECWGESSEGGVKPFRFSDDPSPEDIDEEMGPEFSRRLNREGTAPEKVKFAIAVPVYNYESSRSCSSLKSELDDISQMEDYANLQLTSKKATKLQPAPSKNEHRRLDRSPNMEDFTPT